MFKLPTCPHCGTVYHYKEVKNAVRKKENTCYHCEKQFKATLFPGILIAALLPIALSILLNIVMLNRMQEMQLLPLFAVTLAFLLVIYLIIPFFVSFKKTGENQEKENKRKMTQS